LQQGVHDPLSNPASSIVLVHVEPAHPPYGQRGRRGLIGQRSDPDQPAILATGEDRVEHGAIYCEFRGQAGHVRMAAGFGVGFQI